MPTPQHRVRFAHRLLRAGAIALGSAMLAAGGCGIVTTPLRVHSVENGAYLEPHWATAVFRSPDRETVEVFLSDLPAEQLLHAMESGTSEAAGSVLAINLFMRPKAGQTPIDATACNTTLTYLVFTGTGAGFYGGGGFVQPTGLFASANSEGAEFSASITGGTLKFIRSRGGFSDQLASAELSGSIRAARDEDLAHEISARLAVLLSR
ncbi:MAG TPA: hypothetical protein VG797_08255 [Phycisphaerales bacterium]|nr:hypothetical protein [Phycisphaerales bacterium]